MKLTSAAKSRWHRGMMHHPGSLKLLGTLGHEKVRISENGNSTGQDTQVVALSLPP